MPTYNKYILTGKYPGNTYQNLVQFAAESQSLVDGLGNVINGPINITCSYAVTMSYVTASTLFATSSISSLFATSASWASQSLSSSTSGTASYALNLIGNALISGSNYNITSSWSTNAVNSNNATSASFAPFTASVMVPSASWVSASVKITTADTASYVIGTNVSGIVTSAANSTYAVSASYISSSVFITTAQTASYISASNLPAHTSSWANNSINSNNALSSSWVSSSVFITTAQTASYISASNLPAHTASWANNSINSTNALSASWISSSAFITTAQTASYISASNLPAHTASWANNANTATSASYTLSASYAANGGSGGSPLVSGSTYNITSSWANTASFVQNTDITKSVVLSSSGSNFIILQKNTSSLTTAFYTYGVVSGSNARSGMISTIWNGSSVVFLDNSTADIGDTSDLTMSVILSSNLVQLVSKANTTTNWNVTARGTYV